MKDWTKCLLGVHLWEIASTYPYRDTSYSSVGCSKTEILSVCKRCGKFKVKCVYGYFMLKRKANTKGTER